MTPPSPWQPAPAHEPSAPDATTRSWLREQGSLTARLRRHWPDLAVQVLAEGLGTPLPHEARRLGLADGVPAWLRCVLLVGGGLPRVYARTVIPDGPALATWAEVQALGQQPLGELLFGLPGLDRSGFDWAQGLAWPHANHWPGAAPGRWARRCVFTREHAPLLLTELFLHLPPDGSTPTHPCP